MESHELKIIGNIVRLGNAVNRYRNIQMAELGLTATQGDVVRFILSKNDKALTAKDLMEHLNLSPSTVSGIVSRLCDNGFIKKETDENDLRKTIIVQGEKCKELEETLRQSLITASDVFLKGLSEDEKIELHRLLSYTLENMNNQRYQKTFR